ncbi:MAG: methyltransferase domain-containing protein [Acidimicrobiales bacterium]
MLSFRDIVIDANPTASSEVAWATFDTTIRRWIAETNPDVVLEVGGGRTPLFSAAEARAAGIARYLVNDVSQAELDRLPPDRERACFDIQTGPPPDADYAGRCDFVFAHMVFEHLADPAGAWATIHRLLRPGGTAVSFHPVLYSPPFVLNRILPERLAERVLRTFFGRRNADDHPKFPAYYRWCRASPRFVADRLAPLSFASVDVVPFYGHGYFERLPVLRSVDRVVTDVARRRDVRALASYAYVIVVKGLCGAQESTGPGGAAC